MGSLSIWHWLIVLVVVALLFGGRGKLSGLMGDAAKGIRAFKDGLKEEDQTAAHSGGTLDSERTQRERDEAKG